MVRAGLNDKVIVINILQKAFYYNKSVNYIIKQDKRKTKRIKSLMAYSFDICFRYGRVFITQDRKGCALVLFPDKKKMDFNSILSTIRLVFSCISITRIKRILSRESTVNSFHPENPYYYLWFIGVDPVHQNKGIGTALLNSVMEDSRLVNMPVYLETSDVKNLGWYKKLGFEIYKEIDFTYKLFFLRNLSKN